MRCDREIGARPKGQRFSQSPDVRTYVAIELHVSCKIAVSTFWLHAMDPDRAAPNAGDNLTAVRDILAQAAVQLNNATTGGRASKRFAESNYDNPSVSILC